LEVVKLLVTAGANVNIANMYEPHPTAHCRRHSSLTPPVTGTAAPRCILLR
jgi:hypothetical protein